MVSPQTSTVSELHLLEADVPNSTAKGDKCPRLILTHSAHGVSTTKAILPEPFHT
jgi:hypothetical protein